MNLKLPDDVTKCDNDKCPFKEDCQRWLDFINNRYAEMWLTCWEYGTEGCTFKIEKYPETEQLEHE